MDINEMLRANIKEMISKTASRFNDDDAVKISLNANENPYDLEFTRYPDPFQNDVKTVISKWRNIPPRQIFLGNGSDEIIDLLIRIFCNPSHDEILILNPSLKKINKWAEINDVGVISIGLDETFSFEVKDLLNKLTVRVKIIFLCSPNNTSGQSIPYNKIEAILLAFNGLVFLDESYIDYSEHESFISKLERYDNLLIMQTFSNSLGAAGLRLGMAFSSLSVIDVLNKIKAKHNINQLSQEAALMRFSELEDVNGLVDEVRTNRDILKNLLLDFSFVKEIFPSDANFILVKVKNAEKLYQHLLNNGIVIQNQSHLHQCINCLRITIGNPRENQALLEQLQSFQKIENQLD